MRRMICFLCVICTTYLLCACDPGTFVIDREALNQVTSVELIQYENENQKHFITWVPDQSDELVPFDVTKATVLETLQEEKIPMFLDSFAETDILHTYYAYDSPKDICIRMQYENGDFLIVWANYAEGSFAGYIGEYAADGKVLTFWGSFSSLEYYEELVNQYFTYELQ